MQGEVESEHARAERSIQSEEEARKHIESLAAQVADRCHQIQELEGALNATRQEADQQLHSTVRLNEKNYGFPFSGWVIFKNCFKKCLKYHFSAKV